MIMPTVVVTGCNGFIGNNLVDALLKLDPQSIDCPLDAQTFEMLGSASGRAYFEVVGADIAETASKPNASRFLRSSRFEFVAHTALCDHLRTMPHKPVAVIHNGACSSTVETDPELFRTLNLEYSQRLWEVCADLCIPLIYASSASVYGDGGEGFSDEKSANEKFKPLNLYGKSKHDFDSWVLTQKNTPPTWFGLRYFNVYGPFEAQKGGQASMVYHGYTQATRTGKIRLFKSSTPRFTDGNQQRDFVFVADVVSLTIKLMRRAFLKTPTEGNGCFLNVGVGTPRSWNDLATCVFHSLGMPVNIEYIPIPEALAAHYQNDTCANLGGLKRLGIEPSFTTLEEGVRAYVLKYLLRGL